MASTGFPVARPTDMDLDQSVPAGHAWLEIVSRRSYEAFASAFADTVVLDASIAFSAELTRRLAAAAPFACEK